MYGEDYRYAEITVTLGKHTATVHDVIHTGPNLPAEMDTLMHDALCEVITQARGEATPPPSTSATEQPASTTEGR